MRGRYLTRVAALSILMAAPSAASAFCTEAWVLRNMIFDRLGHCFGSVTGQMLFDNSDCSVSGPTPPPNLAETIRLIRDGEDSVGCRIDTSRPPTAEMIALRDRFQRFRDLPVPDHIGGYACWGYRGPAFRLLDSASMNGAEVGIAQTGQSVVTTYFGGPDGWVFGAIMTGPGGSFLTEGWFAGVDLHPDNCELAAG